MATTMSIQMKDYLLGQTANKAEREMMERTFNQITNGDYYNDPNFEKEWQERHAHVLEAPVLDQILRQTRNEAERARMLELLNNQTTVN